MATRRGTPRPGNGGARPGAGRKPTGRKRLELDTETARLLFIVARHAGITPEQQIARWTQAAWGALDELYRANS